MKALDFFDTIGYIAEDLVTEAKEVPMKQKKRMTRPVKLALIAAAIVALLAGTVLAVVHYTRIADSMESNWNEWAETQMTEEHKDFIEQRSAGIRESVTDQGITVTIDSVTCTEDSIYLMIDYELDPELYDSEKYGGCIEKSSRKYVENEDYGISESGSGGNRTESVYYFTFDELPEGARLNDGKTTMHIEISTILLFAKDGTILPDVEGTWNFEFLLPESESLQNATEETVELESEFPLTITGITVTESYCQFYAVSTAPGYGVVGKDLVDFAREAAPNQVFYSMEAVMADGTTAPSGSGGQCYDEEVGADLVTIEWSAPLDPNRVVSLIFSDGTTEIEIPLQ